MVPESFQVQNPLMLNPPAFMITINYLYSELNYNESPEKRKFIIKGMSKYINYMIKISDSDIAGVMQWKVRDENFAFGSGLDDYPRGKI